MNKILLSLLTISLSCLLFYGLALKGIRGNPYISTEIVNKDDVYKVNIQNFSAKGLPFEDSQETSRFSLVQSIVEDKSLSLDKYAQIAVPDIAYFDGHYASIFPIGGSVISVPFYMIGKYFGYSQLFTYFVPVLFSLFTALLIYVVCVRNFCMGNVVGILAALIFLFGNVTWTYGTTMYVHTISSFCIAYAYYVVSKKKKSVLENLSFWFIYGVSGLVDFPNYIIILPLAIYKFGEVILVKYSDRKMYISSNLRKVFEIIPFFILIAFLLFYNKYTFNSYFALSSSFKVPALVEKGDLPEYENISFYPDLVNNGIFVLLFGLERGLLVFSPIMFLSFVYGIKFTQKYSSAGKLLWITVLTGILLYSLHKDPWGGWSYGPRHLIPIMPLLSIPLGGLLQEVRKKIVWVLFSFFLLVYSVSVSLLGALTSNLIPPAKESNLSEFGSSFIHNIPMITNNEVKTFIYKYYLGEYLNSLAFYILILTALVILFEILFLLLINNGEKRANLS